MKKETWKWYYCDAIQGEENSYELADQDSVITNYFSMV